MKGVHHDDGHDNSPASPFSHSGDINSDLSEAVELYCRNLFNRRRPGRVDSLTLPDFSSNLAGDRRGEKEPFSFHDEGRRRAVKLPAIHQPLLSLIAGILILIVPGLLNLIVALYLIVVGVLGLMRGRNRLFSL